MNEEQEALILKLIDEDLEDYKAQEILIKKDKQGVTDEAYIYGKIDALRALRDRLVKAVEKETGSVAD